MDSVELYADERKFDENILKHFEECQVHLHPYNAIYEDVKSLPEGASILLDPQRVNYALYRNIPEAVRIVKEENPEVLMKCVKMQLRSRISEEVTSKTEWRIQNLCTG